MVRTERTKNQIFKMDGNNCFLEILNDRFYENKVHFNFSNYDPKGESGDKITGKVDFYLSFADALTFCQLVESNYFTDMLSKERKAYHKALLEAEKTNQKCTYFYNKPYWTLMRGTAPEKLPDYLKRSDGKGISRKLQILPGYVKPERMAHPERFKNERKPNRFVIQCEAGAGDKVNSSQAGGYIIKPAYGNKPDVKVMIPVPEIDSINWEDGLMKLAKILKANIEGYIQASYAYEFMNPTPAFISANAVKEKIQVDDIVDIVMYTHKNVTDIKVSIKGQDCPPDEPMVGKPTETNTLEWHFRRRATKAKETFFEFTPYANHEKGETITRKITVVEKSK